MELSLPGAHDAATESLTIGKCQDKDIAELWDAGVRVFDLRPSDSSDECMIYHGNAITGNTGVTLKAALTTINNRLTSNGSEFAIVLMRKEDGGDSWASKVKAVMDQFSNVMPFRSNLRLGDVRGRILVLSLGHHDSGGGACGAQLPDGRLHGAGRGRPGHRHRLDRGLLAAHLLLPPHQAEGICRNLLTDTLTAARASPPINRPTNKPSAI